MGITVAGTISALTKVFDDHQFVDRRIDAG